MGIKPRKIVISREFLCHLPKFITAKVDGFMVDISN